MTPEPLSTNGHCLLECLFGLSLGTTVLHKSNLFWDNQTETLTLTSSLHRTATNNDSMIIVIRWSNSTGKRMNLAHKLASHATPPSVPCDICDSHVSHLRAGTTQVAGFSIHGWKWGAKPSPEDFNQIYKTNKKWCFITTFHTTVRCTRILSPGLCGPECNQFLGNLDSGPPHAPCSLMGSGLNRQLRTLCGTIANGDFF